ncbi:FG-GAP repeat protein [Planotetraspora sp. A-T 1434]|uniref:FG-GAP repeat protein n=1 Tax=Planotetraspora sp. A-T 1434 TaxID=2979219 RepID=UPI0021C00621|nr:FG-GAP repeat protein [Planotetraspora sp. A-T 1434]MCT9931540.1 FG-GAP repeat protein [Planotetraspora sp. A-T 1434]
MRLLRAVPALLLALLVTGLSSPGTAFARADCSEASAADFDGDGTDDAVVGDPFADVRGGQGTSGDGAVAEGAGAVHVLLDGGRGGVLVLQSPDGKAGDGFGWSVRTAHVNGDRCLDVIVGAPYADASGGGTDAGAAYVFYGTPNGPPRVTPLPREPQANAHFGWSLAAAELPPSQAAQGGALVAVGEPHADRDGVTDSGAVHLFDVGDTAKATAVITQDSEGVIGNSEVGDMYGWALALGHLGGKPGELDLAVGVPYENDDGTGRQVASGKIDAGMVGVIFDVRGAAGRYTSRKWDLRQASATVREASGDRFGYALDYAEWKGDGYLAASAPLADAGGKEPGIVEVFVRKGSSELTPVRTVKGRSGGLGGWSLAFWSPRGILSLAVGSPYATAGSGPKESGLVRWIFLNGADETMWLPSGRQERFGASVADLGGQNALSPGERLLIGVPDRGPTGAVALISEGDPVYYGPGKIDGGASADFGSAVAG